MPRRPADTALLAALGERLRAARIAAGLSQAALAERADLAVTTISLMEAGRMAYTVTTASVLARACGVRLADLVDGSGAPDGAIQGSEVARLWSSLTPERQGLMLALLRDLARG